VIYELSGNRRLMIAHSDIKRLLLAFHFSFLLYFLNERFLFRFKRKIETAAVVVVVVVVRTNRVSSETIYFFDSHRAINSVSDNIFAILLVVI
jgi:hypothetical protein